MAANTALVLWNDANPGDAETASGTDAAALVGSSLDGITISVSAATRETSPANGLSEGNITITNTTGTVQTLDIIAGANGFLGPSSLFNLTGTIGVDSGSATLGGSFFVTQQQLSQRHGCGRRHRHGHWRLPVGSAHRPALVLVQRQRR